MNIKDKQKTLRKRLNALRSNATKEELLFKELLDKSNIKYIFQKGFIKGNNYCIVDFYLPKPYKLCIEIDGGYHQTPEQIVRDTYNHNYLVNVRGFKLRRYTNQEVRNMTELPCLC